MRATARPFRLGYRPGLDGLRGLSVLAVLAFHAGLTRSRAAFVGVDVFFVLSGFLITGLLLEEWDRFRGLSLKRFYVRRALRLLPALVVMLLVFVLYQRIVQPGAAPGAMVEALIALFYSSNWALAFELYPLGMFRHTWSLSIEEQFYWLWPVLLLWLLRRTSSRRSLLCWVLLGVFLPSVVRYGIYALGTSFQRTFYGTDARADSLLLGCTVALVLHAEALPNAGWIRLVSRWTPAIAWPGLLALTFYQQAPPAFDVVGVFFLIPACAAALIWAMMQVETSLTNRVLAQPWLVYVGKISYGLYLWHWPVFNLVQARHWTRGKELAVEHALTVAAVLASYYLLERPLLRLKGRFSRLPAPAS